MDRRGASNQVADHLSRLEDAVFPSEEKQTEIDDQFLDEKLFQVDTQESLLHDDEKTRDISKFSKFSKPTSNSFSAITRP